MEITVKTYKEFKELIEGRNIEISKAIVEAIFKNLHTTKKQIFIFHVNVLDDDAFYELTLDRNDFIESLEKNLVIHEKYEEYEVCAKILETIKILKEKNGKNSKTNNN
jgi:protein-arginine kinase activator protein McsA